MPLTNAIVNDKILPKLRAAGFKNVPKSASDYNRKMAARLRNNGNPSSAWIAKTSKFNILDNINKKQQDNLKQAAPKKVKESLAKKTAPVTNSKKSKINWSKLFDKNKKAKGTIHAAGKKVKKIDSAEALKGFKINTKSVNKNKGASLWVILSETYLDKLDTLFDKK